MAIDALQQTNTVKGPYSTGADGTNATSTKVAIPLSQGNAPSDYSFKKSNDQHKEKKTKRTVNELYETIRSVCSRYGLEIKDVKKSGLLSTIAGKSEEELLNAEPSEINKYISCLEAALKKLNKNNNGKINIEELGKLANDYNIAISTGWTIDGYEKAQKSGKESITERIKRFYPNEKNFEKAVERYFKDYLSKLSSKTQLKDFGRLLTNSSDEEVKYFKEAIKTLHKENKLPGFDALLRSLDSVARTNFADDCNVNYIDEIGLSEHEDVRDMTNLIAREQSFEGRIKFHNDSNQNAIDYLNNHKETIKRINEKISKGEQLTPEEQKIKDRIDFYKAVTEGEITGTASNLIITDEEKNELLKKINMDTLHINNEYDNTFYADVMTKVRKYVQEHPETLTMSPEDFYKLMDEVTDGKFTDIYNNSHPDNPLNYKSATTSTPTSASTATGTTTTITQTSVYPTPRSDSQKENTQQDPQSSPNYTTVPFSENSTPFSPILKKISNLFGLNNNENKKIKDVGDLIEIIQNDEIDEETKKFYSKLPANLQENVLRKVSPKKFKELIKETDEKLVMTLKPYDFINAATNNYLLNQQQKIIEMKYRT